MPRAANDVMQSIVFSAVLDAIAALKRASGGLPNQLLRDVQAIHPNVTFADLPKALQDQIAESTRAAFTQLLKEGYAVGPRQQMQTTRPIDRVPEHQRHGRGTPDRRAGIGTRGRGFWTRLDLGCGRRGDQEKDQQIFRHRCRPNLDWPHSTGLHRSSPPNRGAKFIVQIGGRGHHPGHRGDDRAASKRGNSNIS